VRYPKNDGCMRVIAFLFFLFVFSGASGKTFYVATNGNDNNPGTINNPWAT